MQKKQTLKKLMKAIKMNQSQNQMSMKSQKTVSRLKKSPSNLARELSVLQPTKKAKRQRRKT